MLIYINTSKYLSTKHHKLHSSITTILQITLPLKFYNIRISFSSCFIQNVSAFSESLSKSSYSLEVNGVQNAVGYFAEVFSESGGFHQGEENYSNENGWWCMGMVNIIVISIMIVLSFKRQVTDNPEVTLGKKGKQ